MKISKPSLKGCLVLIPVSVLSFQLSNSSFQAPQPTLLILNNAYLASPLLTIPCVLRPACQPLGGFFTCCFNLFWLDLVQLFISCSGEGVWTGFVLGRQVLYHWTIPQPYWPAGTVVLLCFLIFYLPWNLARAMSWVHNETIYLYIAHFLELPLPNILNRRYSHALTTLAPCSRVLVSALPFITNVCPLIARKIYLVVQMKRVLLWWYETPKPMNCVCLKRIGNGWEVV
jgi:hypothetical protein